MNTQLFWIAFASVIIALFAIRALIESIAIMNWYKHTFQANANFKSPPQPTWWLRIINNLLQLPKL